MQLSILLQQQESETLEFKSQFNSDVVEVAVSFANTQGGYILIGVNDDGNIGGRRFGKEATRDYSNRISTNTEPMVMVSAVQHHLEDGDGIIIQANEMPMKPVATRGRSYRRSGSSTRIMSASEITLMHMGSSGQSMDSIIEDGKTIENLDLEAVRQYMHKANHAGRRSFLAHDDPWMVLKKLELVRSESQITRAAILLFGKTPQSPLTQAVVQAGRVRQRTYLMDSRVIVGRLYDQIDETVEFIKKNLHVRFEISGTPERKDVWDYPLIAVREAITNAICHRDYGDVGHIQVKISEESLQIWNPGPLPFDFSLQELVNPDHASRPRNKSIAQILFDMGYIERYGGGIQRMFDQCQAAGLQPPSFQQTQGGIKVVFRK